MKDTRNDAHGKWRGILQSLGFTDKELSGNHGPCPICEGKDRFRFTDYKGGGEYFCSGCGAGAGFDLIMQKFDWEFGYTAKKVDEILGTGVKEVFKPKVDVEKRRRDLNTVWAKERSMHMHKYLMDRGICENIILKCNDLRGVSNLYMAGSNETHEGMLALVRNHEGAPVSIHRTYLRDRQRKMMPPTEKISGAAIRLGQPGGDELVVGEGIETTLSGMQYYGVAEGYACISALGMETVRIPPTISKVFILADNDHSFTGQRAAFILARHFDNKGKEITVAMSTARGDDFNDVIKTSQPILEFYNNDS